MAAPGKQYGLIIPKKLLQKNVCLPKHSAFADDSDDELSVGESLQKESLKKRVMKQTKLEVQKALEEDSTVYEYDNVYDDIQKKKEESAAKLMTGKDRKPKYIQNILKAVEVRKKEQEKRMEKKIQKEREMEGDEFQDKEAFVTSAYKLKLQQKAEEEEREKREAALEATLDVTKQKDLSGFYRHLLNQTVGEGKAPESSSKETEVKQEKPKGYSDELNSGNLEDNIDADSDLGTESSDEEEVKTDRKPPTKSSHSDRRERSSKTNDRQQDSSSSSADQDDHHKQKERYKSTSEEGRPEKDRPNQRDYKGEMEERPRHGEHGKKDSHRRKDHDSQTRVKERRENESSSKDGRREKGRRKEEEERYTERDQERGKRHKEREGSEKEYKARERADRPDRERTSRQDRERAGRMDKEHRESPDQGKDHGDLEKKERSPSPSEMKCDENMSDSKRKVEETPKVVNSESGKFAKRSNEETLGSARDRYLARQMARAGNKTHVEKEED